ncbi:MAG: hypothetical protein Solivirus2_64 [Solivirus sp.]|uniref:ATPase AAA-type core domain-containing protein n=1 Tax=Solivirus sp. TaxID=2487772 RepID=A0A3G5AJF2_9VIRU|nr:MAG: hypothetical protein Solivirus2_64 [Solivirus sp.]
MNVDTITLFYILALGLILFYIYRELVNDDNDTFGKLFLVAIIIGIIAFAFYVYYSSRQEEALIEEDASNLDDCFPVELDPERPNSDKGQDTLASVVYDISSTDLESDEIGIKINQFAVQETNEITYEKFKNWYLSPKFISKYTEAMKESCKIYKRKIFEIRKQFQEELKAVKPKEIQSPLSSIMNIHDETKILETTIAELGLLYKEIIAREKLIDENYCKKGLITALTDRKSGIDSILGRKEMKDFLALRLYAFAQNPQTFLNSFQHIELNGPAGSGKTKIAKVISFVYAKSGMILRDHIHITTPQHYTTAYVNESQKMTRKLLLSTLGSAVFIDECYQLGSSKNAFYQAINHGDEAITEIINFIDKMRPLCFMIVAGYEKEMEAKWRNSNEGIPRRFPHRIIFQPYDAKALTSIAIQFLTSTCQRIQLTKHDIRLIYTLINHINETEPAVFDNQAGSVENLIDSVSKSIYGSPDKSFEKNSRELILGGFNSYLKKYEISIELDTIM